MLDKLQAVEVRFLELSELLSDPQVVSNRESYTKFSKEFAELGPIVDCFRRYQRVSQDLEDNKEILRDSNETDLRQLAQEEISSNRDEKEKLYQELMFLLLPKDPSDEKNIILEIRAGTGGDEAALFSGALFNMYVRFSEARNWRVEILSSSESSVGGFKEVIARIVGNGAFSQFKYEKGVHRVQRVPTTETQGRIHTSTCTVAVLPEAEEVDIDIQDKDLRIDVFRSSGPGGQSVNTTDSAVRITHLPSGLVVSCQDEKSQHKNRAKAMTVLRARLFDQMQAAADAERRDDRRSQIGSGERSERIRTYNFPQGRVSDHRIGLTVYQIDKIMAGNLEIVIDPLIAHYRSLALKGEEVSLVPTDDD